MAFRHCQEPIETVLHSWIGQTLKVSTPFGRRALAAWVAPGPPKSHRAMAVTAAEDLASMWLLPPKLDETEPWEIPEPRERHAFFKTFQERLTVSRKQNGVSIRTDFSFTHREPPGAQRGDALQAEGHCVAHLNLHGTQLLDGEGTTRYQRYGREVGVDIFRLGPDARPFSWS